jgi:Do/DeqQ family serine protease
MRKTRPCTPVRRLMTAMLMIVALTAWQGFTPAEALDLTTAIIDVAKNTIPAVVHIEVTERQEVSNPMLPFENDPFFRRFFGIPKKMHKKFKQEIVGLGTGMIMDSDGHILTNYHVAGGATKIEVVLYSGQRYSAKLVGGDAKTDLAVIKIAAKERLASVKFGNSDEMQVGQWVVAIGEPRGLDQSVTQGIISAKHRTGITDPSSYQDFLQTDAAINPGNSGGPLLNLKGEVIGINSVIASSSGGFEGIGFSIPSNIALHIGRTLVAHGKVIRGWLGVTVEDVSYDRAKSLGLAAPKGAHVLGVMKGSPAEAAGIEKGDIITSFDGSEVANASILRNQVSVTAVGQQVKVGVLRAHKTYNLTVKIGTLQEAAKAFAQSAERILGAVFRPVTTAEAQKYGLTSKKGVAIMQVEPNGPLGQAGFEKDDIILEINGQGIGDLESFLELASTLKPHQQITFLALDHASGETGQVRVTTR